jgi:hypothetical protein
VACTIATNGALRNRWQLGPAALSSRKLQPASGKAGTCRCRGTTGPVTSLGRYPGSQQVAETAVSGRLLLQRMQHYRILAKHNQWTALPYATREPHSVNPRFFSKARPSEFPSRGGDGRLSASIFLRCASSFAFADCIIPANCS